jgi:hypothetical protein
MVVGAVTRPLETCLARELDAALFGPVLTLCF